MTTMSDPNWNRPMKLGVERKRRRRGRLIVRESEQRAFRAPEAGDPERDAEARSIESHRSRQLSDCEWIGNVQHVDLRIREAADPHPVSRRGCGTQPIRIGRVGVRVVQRNGLDEADVIVSVESCERHGVRPVLQEAAVHGECARRVLLIGKVQLADRRAVEGDRDAMRLAVRNTL